MFTVDEISKGKRKRYGRRRIDKSLDGIMPSKSTREKRSTARLNLGEKCNGVGRSLSALEEEFIYAAEFGDIPTVQRILQENTNFNIDYTDILGRTPLRLAVGNEHLEVVELLLDRCNTATIHEALLQAISAGHENIAETILKHPKYKDVKRENKRFGETDYFYNQTSEDSPFSSDITPLILAAERNQFEIVQLLLLRGDTIKKPHHYYCACQECSNKLQFDQLRLAKTRLNAYKGLASGAYISLSSKDPILTAFELAQELRDVARVEKYFKTEYLALADQLSQYVVKLLDKVRGHDELEILLNKTGRASDEESYELLDRLKMAIQYNEKKFVAHPSCQQKLVSIWYSNFRSLERSNWYTRILIISLVTTVYPILAICYWFAPKSKLRKILRCPCVKFIGHTMMFVVFLIMIIISTLTEHPDPHKLLSKIFTHVNIRYQYFRNNTSLSHFPKDFVVRSFEPEIIHVVLSIWIIGMLWQEIKQVYAEGIYNYFDSLYNYLDCAVLTLYITSFTLRYLSIIKVRIALKYFESRNSWELLTQRDKTAESYWYWLLADRYYWVPLDPHNIAESLFAIANVISFTRVSYVLPANELFGPMQISLARMIGDILKFAVIICVVILAFMVGLYNLYWYYSIRSKVEIQSGGHGINTSAEKYFKDLDNTFRTVFWSLFGRGEPTVVELQGFNHYFTQNVGYWIFGAYNISTVIVLLNMLIAMMTRSFECIQTEADTEWKFARSKLYMEYIREDCTLPVPFNIVPSFKSIYYLFRFFYRLCVKVDEPTIRHPGRIKDVELYAMPSGRRQGITPLDATAWDSDFPHLKGIKHFQERMSTTNGFVRNDSDPSICTQKLTYQRVMKRIVKRYIFDMQRESDTNEGASNPYRSARPARTRSSSLGDTGLLKYSWKIFRQTVVPKMVVVTGKTKLQVSEIRASLAHMAQQNIDIFFALLSRTRHHETRTSCNIVTPGCHRNSVMLLPLLANRGDFDELKQDISSFRYEMLNHIATSQNDKKSNQEQMDQLSNKVNQLVRQNDILLNMLQRTMSNYLSLDKSPGKDTPSNDKDDDSEGGNDAGGIQTTTEAEVAVSPSSSDTSTLDTTSADTNGSNSGRDSLQDLSDGSTVQQSLARTSSDKDESRKTTSKSSSVDTVDVQIEIEPVHTKSNAYQQYVKRL